MPQLPGRKAASQSSPCGLGGQGTGTRAAQRAPVGDQARRSDGSLTLQLPAPLVTATVTPRRARLSPGGLCGALGGLPSCQLLEDSDGHRAAQWGCQ